MTILALIGICLYILGIICAASAAWYMGLIAFLIFPIGQIIGLAFICTWGRFNAARWIIEKVKGDTQ